MRMGLQQAHGHWAGGAAMVGALARGHPAGMAWASLACGFPGGIA